MNYLADQLSQGGRAAGCERRAGRRPLHFGSLLSQDSGASCGVGNLTGFDFKRTIGTGDSQESLTTHLDTGSDQRPEEMPCDGDGSSSHCLS